jgi:hypothetical protein
MKPGHMDKGALDSYTFTAATGESIALRVADIAGGALWPEVVIYGPTGSQVSWGAGPDVASAMLVAPSTGTYTAVVFDISSGAAATGDYNLYYIKAPDANQGGR